MTRTLRIAALTLAALATLAAGAALAAPEPRPELDVAANDSHPEQTVPGHDRLLEPEYIEWSNDFRELTATLKSDHADNYVRRSINDDRLSGVIVVRTLTPEIEELAATVADVALEEEPTSLTIDDQTTREMLIADLLGPLLPGGWLIIVNHERNVIELVSDDVDTNALYAELVEASEGIDIPGGLPDSIELQPGGGFNAHMDGR